MSPFIASVRAILGSKIRHSPIWTSWLQSTHLAWRARGVSVAQQTSVSRSCTKTYRYTHALSTSRQWGRSGRQRKKNTICQTKSWTYSTRQITCWQSLMSLKKRRKRKTTTAIDHLQHLATTWSTGFSLVALPSHTKASSKCKLHRQLILLTTSYQRRGFLDLLT